MSYSFTVPAAGAAKPYVTLAEFEETATDVLDQVLSSWADGDQKKATQASATDAINAAAALASEGVVGETFSVYIYGHANPTPGKPEAGSVNDSCNIQLLAKTAEATSDGEATTAASTSEPAEATAASTSEPGDEERPF
jgi:hypothetical protein